MERTDLAGMTVAELKALAKKRKVALPAGAKKADLIAALGGNAKAGARPKAASAARKTRPTAAGAKKAAKTGGRAKAGTAGTAAPARAGGPARRITRTTGEPLQAQEQVSDAKYYSGPQQRPPQRKGLPVEYGEERIALLARDPDTVFAYWEVPKARLEKERAAQGKESRLCIRVYDVTGVRFNGSNATSSVDQEVYERLGSWYFTLRRPAHTFVADVGLRSRGGAFRTIARSAAVTMPRAGVSDLEDLEWRALEEDLLRLYGLGAAAGRDLSSARALEQLRQRLRMDAASPGVSSWTGRPEGR